MTVNTSDITSGPYSGNDVTTEFAYDFRIENKNQVTVFETDDSGVETTLTVDTDYTVAGIGNDGGGQITRVAGALPTGYTWYIRSNYQPTQQTDFESQGGFFPDVHEAAFDKLTFLIQQINDQIARSFKLSDSYSGNASAALPDPEALKFLRWNAAANALELVDGTTSATAADVVNVPAGNISATDVQAALNELDSEKEPADPTILKDADIGSSVQAYDADTAKTDVAQTFSASQRGSVTTANTLAYDMNVANNFDSTPVATQTIAFSNITAGQSGNISIDNTAGVVIGVNLTHVVISSAALARLNVAGVYPCSYYSPDGTTVEFTVGEASTVGGV